MCRRGFHINKRGLLELRDRSISHVHCEDLSSNRHAFEDLSRM